MTYFDQQFIPLGTAIFGDSVRVTDPCYDKGAWCAGVIRDVLPGRWAGAVVKSSKGGWGNRVDELLAWHADTSSGVASNAHHAEDIDVGVDSGQCGFFDERKFPDGQTWGDSKNDAKDEFYDRACKGTLNELGARVLEEGFVSSSGFGDGSYTCYTARNDKGQVIAMKVVFIGDEEEENEEDE